MAVRSVRVGLWCITLGLVATTAVFAHSSFRFRRDLNRWATEPSVVESFAPADFQHTQTIAWQQDCDAVCKQGLYARAIDPSGVAPRDIDSLLGYSGYANLTDSTGEFTQLEFWNVDASETGDPDGWVLLAMFTPPQNGPASLAVIDVSNPQGDIPDAHIEFMMRPHLCGIEQMASMFSFAVTLGVGVVAATLAIPLWCTRRPRHST